MSENQPSKTVAKLKRKRKQKSLLNYILLFLCVFAVFIIIFLSGIKSYTPIADVTIGNNEVSNDGDMDVEIKSVDERLKWIQMEDVLPSVALRDSKTDEEISKYTLNSTSEMKSEEKEEETPEEKQTVVSPPKPTIKEIPKVETQVKTAQLPTPIIPLPVRTETVTKVYLGGYDSLEDAIIMQKKVNIDFPDTSPFIKASNNSYMVQLGSFADKEKADNFVLQLKEKGYNPKTL